MYHTLTYSLQQTFVQREGKEELEAYTDDAHQVVPKQARATQYPVSIYR